MSEDIQQEFQAAQEEWRQAINAHRMAPPDDGFSGRLHALAQAAWHEAEICRKADAAGYEWPPHQAGPPPYELQAGTGRRGPAELWRTFDAAVTEMGRAGAGTDLIAVADAHQLLGDIAEQLAQAVAAQDSTPRRRARPRSA